ncbi:hypothetical protein HOY80DRAFT_986336 [Tuber brumale]|nr:hypothetical protein HOY80DRAFT_986336 [Tuber brumale]
MSEGVVEPLGRFVTPAGTVPGSSSVDSTFLDCLSRCCCCRLFWWGDGWWVRRRQSIVYVSASTGTLSGFVGCLYYIVLYFTGTRDFLSYKAQVMYIIVIYNTVCGRYYQNYTLSRYGLFH